MRAPFGRGLGGLHRGVAPLVAFLASALAVTCLGSVPGLVSAARGVPLVDARWVGWVGVAVLLAVLVAFAVVLAALHVGPGAALAAGAGCAVVGLVLGRDIASDLQLALAPLWLGAAVGCLLAGGASLAWELPRRTAGQALAGWLVPLAAGWPLATWAFQHSAGGGGSLSIHVAAPLLVPVGFVVAAWGVVDLLTGPTGPRWRPSPVVSDTAWVGLGLLAAVGATVLMLLGFAGRTPDHWLRPLVVAAIAVVAGGFALVGRLLLDRDVRRGYVAVLAALVCAPSCIQLLMGWVASGTGGPGVAAALIPAGGGCLGAGLGIWHPHSWAVGGVAAVALGAAGGWVLPDDRWLVVPAAVVLLFGTGAALAAGVRLSCRDPLSLGFVVVAGIAGLLFGLVVAVPLGWALTGAIPVHSPGLLTVGRVVLGCTVAVTVMTGALLAATTPVATAAQ